MGVMLGDMTSGENTVETVGDVKGVAEDTD
jgi:hypothetical protein